MTGCIKVCNFAMSSDSTSMNPLCIGGQLPPATNSTPTSLHRARQSVTGGVPSPRCTAQLLGVWWDEMWNCILSSKFRNIGRLYDRSAYPSTAYLLRVISYVLRMYWVLEGNRMAHRKSMIISQTTSCSDYHWFPDIPMVSRTNPQTRIIFLLRLTPRFLYFAGHC